MKISYPGTALERIRWRSAVPHPAPSLRAADDGGNPGRCEPDRRSQGAGCDLAGGGPGRAGKLFPPGAAEPAPHRGGGVPVRSAEDTTRSPGQPARPTTRCCAPTRARMISSAWRRCSWRPSITPGAPSRSSGSTRWTGAVSRTWRLDPEHQQVMRWYGRTSRWS